MSLDPFTAPTGVQPRRVPPPQPRSAPDGPPSSSTPAPDASDAAPAAPAAPADAPAGEGEKGKASRARGVAMGGKPVDGLPAAPPAPQWPVGDHQIETYAPDASADYSDLSQVNQELNRCRSRLFHVSRELKAAQRDAADAELAYRRAMRRALVTVSGGSAETRKALAELQCEGLENAVVITSQVAEEWKKRATDCRDDLKSVENLAHNVRAQMAIQ